MMIFKNSLSRRANRRTVTTPHPAIIDVLAGFWLHSYLATIVRGFLLFRCIMFCLFCLFVCSESSLRFPIRRKIASFVIFGGATCVACSIESRLVFLIPNYNYGIRSLPYKTSRVCVRRRRGKFLRIRMSRLRISPPSLLGRLRSSFEIWNLFALSLRYCARFKISIAFQRILFLNPLQENKHNVLAR